MLKIRMYLLLQCAVAIYFIHRLHNVATPNREVFNVVLAGYALALIPFLVGIFLLGMTLFPIERRNGQLYYDPTLPPWRLAKKLDGDWNDRIRWCVINWKLMGIFAIVAFLGGCVVCGIFTPHRPHASMNWMGLMWGMIQLIALMLGPALVGVLTANRWEWTNKLVGACLITYYLTGATYLVHHIAHRGWTTAMLHVGLAVLGAAMIVGALVGIAILITKFSEWLGHTAFGLWAKGLCPVLIPLPKNGS
ncbi:MAG: hypothetical protein ABSE18_02380 [Minisyncoccia bacterium]|jgi:hypothetical protein